MPCLKDLSLLPAIRSSETVGHKGSSTHGHLAPCFAATRAIKEGHSGYRLSAGFGVSASAGLHAGRNAPASLCEESEYPMALYASQQWQHSEPLCNAEFIASSWPQIDRSGPVVTQACNFQPARSPIQSWCQCFNHQNQEEGPASCKLISILLLRPSAQLADFTALTILHPKEALLRSGSPLQLEVGSGVNLRLLTPTEEPATGERALTTVEEPPAGFRRPSDLRSRIPQQIIAPLCCSPAQSFLAFSLQLTTWQTR